MFKQDLKLKITVFQNKNMKGFAGIKTSAI